MVLLRVKVEPLEQADSQGFRSTLGESPPGTEADPRPVSGAPVELDASSTAAIKLFSSGLEIQFRGKAIKALWGRCLSDPPTQFARSLQNSLKRLIAGHWK